MEDFLIFRSSFLLLALFADETQMNAVKMLGVGLTEIDLVVMYQIFFSLLTMTGLDEGSYDYVSISVTILGCGIYLRITLKFTKFLVLYSAE